MFKRLLYLVGINIALVITVNILMAIVSRVFNIEIMPDQYQGLLVLSVVLGFGGAFVNLLMSKNMAKRIYKIQLIDSSINDPKLRIVYQTVSKISQQHHIKTPEVGYYQASEVNAFATGASKNSSLVAVSSSLLHIMTPEEIEGVIGHEMSHILNGDMITGTLLQGSLNTFTVFIARILAGIINGALSRGENSRGGGFYFLIVTVLDILFGFLAGLVLMAHTRQREYAADRGAAQKLGKEKMIAGLQKLLQLELNPVPKDSFSSMKLSGPLNVKRRMMSHPPLEERIARLERM